MDEIVIVLPQTRFNNFEFSTVAQGLIDKGHRTWIAVDNQQTATGYLQKTPSGMARMTVQADLSIEQIRTSQITALILIGGAGVKNALWHNPILHNKLREADQQKILIAAICLAPITLVYAGLAVGKQIACYATQETKSILQQHGIAIANQPLLSHRHILTANGPKASMAFTETILSYLEDNLKTNDQFRQ